MPHYRCVNTFTPFPTNSRNYINHQTQLFMKYSIGILTTVTLFAAFVVLGCDSSSNEMERAETSVIEAERDYEIAKTEVEADLRKFKVEKESRIAENEQNIEEIKLEINNESNSELRSNHQQRLDRHVATNRQLKRELDNYNVSDRNNWNNFKNNFETRMDDLGDSLNNFFSRSTTNRPSN